MCVYVYKHASVPTCLAKETERLSNLDPCKDEKETRERAREGKVECGGGGDNVVGGGGWPTAEKEREGRAHRGQKERDEELCGGVCPDLEHVVARCRRRPKIEPLFFFSALLLLLLLLCCQRKGRGFLEGSSLPDTEQGEAAGALQR